MRSFASGFVSKILMIFLVISFGIWGIGDIFRNTGPSYAARVGGETIGIVEFQQQKSLMQRQLEAMGAKGIDPTTMEIGILRKLIQQKLILETMHDLNLYVNDTLLAQAVREQPAFQNADGSFSSNNFRAIIRAEGSSEGAILKQIKEEAAGRFLLSSLDMADVTPPAPVRTLLTTAALETRDTWIVNIAPLTSLAPVDEKEAEQFYEKNKTVLYSLPETRTIEYIALRPSQLDELSDKSITDEMVADAKQSQPKASEQTLRDRLRTEQRDSALRNFSAAVDDALAGGAKLNEAVAKAGIQAQAKTLTDANDTLAKASTDDVTKTVAEQAFQMGENEASGVIVTPKGVPVIVYVKSIHPAAPQPYEKVASDVRARVGDEDRREATRARVQEVKQALSKLDEADANDKQWQAVLNKFNLNPRRITNLSRPTDLRATVNGIPAPLHQAIFERQLGAVAGPYALENGGQMLAIITDIHHPTAAAVAEKSRQLDQKNLKDLTAEMNQIVQARAFESFANRHQVKINPQLLTRPAASEPSDEEPRE